MLYIRKTSGAAVENRSVRYSEEVMKKILTIYYSRDGENYWNGEIRTLAEGNTKIAAEYIQEAVGGDIFRVETEKDYPEKYLDCIEAAKKELREHARPQLRKWPEDLDSYDIIFIGYPNWWGTLPMVMYNLLEKSPLKGKTVIPFCTNEGSGMGSSERALGLLCRGCRILPGLSVKGCETQQRKEEIQNWAKESVQK